MKPLEREKRHPRCEDGVSRFEAGATNQNDSTVKVRRSALRLSVEELASSATIFRLFPGTEIIEGTMGDFALSYAAVGWEVFPLRGKIPAIAGGRGVLDATNDPAKIARWWSEYPTANIGGRVPPGLIVVDLDPRKQGAVEWLDEKQQDYGELPATLTAFSGRGDGGCHRYFLHPGGELVANRAVVPDGIDLKSHGGYCVLPPSLHPDSRQPYWWDDLATVPARLPGWLLHHLRPRALTPPTATSRHREFVSGVAGARCGRDSIADWFNETRSWADILHGWQCRDGDGDRDGARWRHPSATSPVSATVRHGCLFVYSPNTPFDVTTPDDRHGYTRFRAWAVLEHGGDLSTAARVAYELRKSTS